MTLSRFNRWIFDVGLEKLSIFVWWWVGGDELGAGVEEEFFEGGNAFLTKIRLVLHMKRVT